MLKSHTFTNSTAQSLASGAARTPPSAYAVPVQTKAKGSTVVLNSAASITAPNSPPPSPLTPSDVPSSDCATSSSQVGVRVLVCDDETRLGDLTAGLLEECGFPAAFVPAGEQALDYLRRHPETGVLLLDVNLATGLSTQELMARLYDQGIPVRVLLTSGSAKQDVDPRLVAHPLVVGYLEKPYTEEALTAAVAAASA